MMSPHRYKVDHMSKRRQYALSIDADLVKKIKIQAIHEDRNVSDIVEELLLKYLKQKKGKARR